MGVIDQRVGQFKIDRSFIFDEDNLDILLRIMGKVLVVKAEMDVVADAIVYTAFSRYFEPVEDVRGKIPPMYDVTYDSDTQTVGFVKVRDAEALVFPHRGD